MRPLEHHELRDVARAVTDELDDDVDVAVEEASLGLGQERQRGAAPRLRGDDRVVVVVNLSSRRRNVTVTAPRGESLSGSVADLRSGRTYAITNRSFHLTLAPYAYLIGALHA